MSNDFLEIKDLKIHFPIKGGFFNTVKDHVKAVDGVSISIPRGRTYGLAGESGSGKTTTGKAGMGRNDITEGELLSQGERSSGKGKNKCVSRDIQRLCEEPYSKMD